MKISINVSKIYRNSNNLILNIQKYYAEILISLVIVMLICIIIFKNNNYIVRDYTTIDNNDLIEGFSKVNDFKNRKKNRERNKYMVEGTKYDKLANSMKLLDENSKNSSDSFFGELFTNISLNDDNDLDKKIKYNKNGSKASMKNVKNNIIDYYNHFDQEKFTKKTNSTLESLRKFKHFKEEFWNIFDY